MKADPILRKAVRLARSRRYEGAIRTLEPEVNRYYGSFRYYYLLGVICLYAGDFGGALTWLRLAREIKMRDPGVLLGLAVLYLRRGETGKAVDFYLDVQEMDPKNRTARKALGLIRKYSNPERFSAWLESGGLPNLFPPLPRAGFSADMALIPGAALIGALFLVFGILVLFKVIPNPLQKRGSRSPAQFSLSPEDRGEPVQTGGVWRYVLSRREALDAYDRALSLFTSWRDEAAKVNLNRILESNASEGLKNKSRLLLGFMAVPGFDNFNRADNVSFSEAKREIALYRDVYVIWRGMATNVETTEQGVSFDFLVGYDTYKTLEGIVPVVFEKTLAVNPERPLEVLGKIVPVSSVSGEGIRLEGVAIHQSGRLENTGK
jgi:tetratricopeptide (TPR) repeat protein